MRTAGFLPQNDLRGSSFSSAARPQHVQCSGLKQSGSTAFRLAATAAITVLTLDPVQCQTASATSYKPVITAGKPFRLGQVVSMCCEARPFNGERPKIRFTIVPNNDYRTDNYPVFLPNSTGRQCYRIKVVLEHHKSSARCSSWFGTGSNVRGFEAEPFPFTVLVLSKPILTGPTSLKSGQMGTYECEVKNVSYESSNDFTLTWRVDSVPGPADRRTDLMTGTVTDSQAPNPGLKLHHVRSAISFTAPVNHGATQVEHLIECVVWHVGLNQWKSSLVASLQVCVDPQQAPPGNEVINGQRISTASTTAEENGTTDNPAQSLAPGKGHPFGVPSSGTSTLTLILVTLVSGLATLLLVLAAFCVVTQCRRRGRRRLPHKGQRQLRARGFSTPRSSPSHGRARAGSTSRSDAGRTRPEATSTSAARNSVVHWADEESGVAGLPPSFSSFVEDPYTDESTVVPDSVVDAASSSFSASSARD